MTQHIRLKPSTLQEDHKQKDSNLLELIKVIKASWPETKWELSHLVLPFFDVRDELSVYDGTVIRGERVVVPKSLRRDTLYRFHHAHSGVVSILSLARESKKMQKCVMSARRLTRSSLRRLFPREVPDRPRAKVWVDLFTYRGRNYLICVDYYSSFWVVDPLDILFRGR